MAAQARRRQAYRPATLNNLRSSHTLFLQFCQVFGVNFTAPDLDDLAAFSEWLIGSGLSPKTIHNHLSALRTLYIWWDKPQVVALFSADNWTLTMRAISNTTRPSLSIRAAMSVEHFFLLVQVCSSDPALLPIRVGLLLGFFGFLRVSNLAPATIHGWDPDRNTSWGDLNVSSDGIIFNLKWSKTRQHADHSRYPPTSTGRFFALPPERLVPVRLRSFRVPAPFSHPITHLHSTTDGSPYHNSSVPEPLFTGSRSWRV